MPTQLYTVGLEVLKLALTQADLRQKDLDATSSNITNRVENLLTLFVGVVIASMGFGIAHKSEGLLIVIPTMATILYSFQVCCYLIVNAYTGTYIPVAGTPSILLQVKLIEAGSKDDKLANLYLSLLQGADDRIKANLFENERRGSIIKKAIKAAVGMPIVLVIIYLVVQCLDWMNCLSFLAGRLD